MTLGGSRLDKSPVRQGLRWNGSEPVIANGESARKTGKDWQHGGWKNSHDAAGGGASDDRAFLRLPSERVAEIRDEAIIGCHGWNGSGVTAEKLRVRSRVTFAGIRTRHEVSARVGGRNR